jgi:hypothetical protein
MPTTPANRKRPTAAGKLPAALLLSVVRVLADPVMHDPSRDTNGLVDLVVTNAGKGAYVLEASPTLGSWTPVVAQTSANGALHFKQPPPSGGVRFYRVRPAATNEAPNPVFVAATTGPLSVTNLVDGAGGTFSLTNAQQVVYTLSLPAGAAGQFAAVRMTEVTAVGPLPLAGPFLGGVTLGPDGLALVTPGVLTITWPTNIPATTAGFAWRSPSGEFRLAPALVSSNSITFNIADFQPCAAATYAPADIQALATREPADPADQFEHNLGLAYDGPTGPRTKHHGPSIADIDTSGIAAIARGFYAQLESAAAAGAEDDDLLDTAIGNYQVWAPIAKLVSSTYPEFIADDDAIVAVLATDLRASMTRNRLRCNFDDLNSIAKMLRTYQWMQQAPFAAKIGDLSSYRQTIKDCAQFELKLDSTVSESTCSRGFIISSHLTADYKITTDFTPDGNFTCTSGPTLEALNIEALSICNNVSIEFPNDPVGETANGSGVVSGMMFSVPPRRTPDAAFDAISTIRLRLFPFIATPDEGKQFVGIYGSPPPTLPTHTWAGTFAIAHVDEVVQVQRGQVFEFTGFHRSVNEAVVATKNFADSVQIGPANFQEQTTLDLIHTPN